MITPMEKKAMLNRTEDPEALRHIIQDGRETRRMVRLIYPDGRTRVVDTAAMNISAFKTRCIDAGIEIETIGEAEGGEI